MRFMLVEPTGQHVAGTLSLRRVHGNDRIDDLASDWRGVSSGLQAIAAVEQLLERAGQRDRSVENELAERYWMLFRLCLQTEGPDDLARECLRRAALLRMAPSRAVKVAVARVLHRLFGGRGFGWWKRRWPPPH